MSRQTEAVSVRHYLRAVSAAGRRLTIKLWPDTLAGRLALLLITGLLSAQMLTGTIWHDMRQHYRQEVPTRLLASRVTELIQALSDADATLPHFSALSFQVHYGTPPPAPRPDSTLERDLEALFSGLLSQHLNASVQILSFKARFYDTGPSSEKAQPAPDKPQHIETRFHVQLLLEDERWLSIEATEVQSWPTYEPWQVFADYFLRIYLFRMGLLMLVVLIAVRMVVMPIHRLAEAAQSLGRDLKTPPLTLEGPVEARRAATAFNTMQTQLAQHVDERTRFLAAISHDLRSPITRLRLRTEWLQDPVLKRKFQADLTHMESLVTSTLDFVHSGESTEAAQKIDLDSMLASLVNDGIDLGQYITIAGSAGSPINGFPRSLKRCLQNLLDNALRYGQSAHIDVQDATDTVQISIRDEGPGIPAEFLARITEPFYRIDGSRNQGTGGYGLGLSIAQTVIDAHQGSLMFRNHPGGGLVVDITLPRDASRA